MDFLDILKINWVFINILEDFIILETHPTKMTSPNPKGVSIVVEKITPYMETLIDQIKLRRKANDALPKEKS